MVALGSSLHGAVDEILPGVIADRRHLHEHPELGMQEYETAKLVAARLEALGLDDIRTGIANTGITALIHGTNPNGAGKGKVVMLRADMDALPIEEQNDVEYKSTNPGVMHACGHDGHTAMLLGVARLLMERRDQFAGTVKVLFQPSEELQPGGAKPMIEAGVLEDPKVDAAFGMHIAQAEPLGTIVYRPGPSMAAADSFRMVIQGKGGHGARPHDSIDPIAIGAYIITALQTIVSREVDPLQPAVVTVGALLSGNAGNVIPDTAELRGTVRSFDPNVRQHLAERVQAVAKGVGAAMRAEVTIDYEFGYPPTVNDPAMTEIVRKAATEVLDEEHVKLMEPMMGAEDMSYFLEKVPGCYFHVGSKNEERGLIWGHHHPRFDFDEAALGIGIEVMMTTVLRYFEQAS